MKMERQAPHLEKCACKCLSHKRLLPRRYKELLKFNKKKKKISNENLMKDLFGHFTGAFSSPKRYG